MAPTPGETMKYEALVAVQDKVTLPPEVPVWVKLVITGAAPWGTVLAV
jgi:hypothetical protein